MKRTKNLRQDFYFKKAKKENYPARSVYKLQEIDSRYGLVKKDDFILDIGCSPGSWMLYLGKKVGNQGKVIGIDLVEPKIVLQKNMKFVKGDIRSYAEIIEGRFDVVVSDAAPETMGVHSVDVAGSLELAKVALKIVEKTLKPDGNFLCKIFEGEGTEELLKEAKALFSFIKPFRPMAVRKHSREFYLIAKNFKNGKK